MNNIHIETLGCRLNQIESEAAAQFFTDRNFTVDMLPLTADTRESDSVRLCIINTCTVTQKAEQKARRIIRLMLKKYPLACIIVTGCYAQLSRDEIKKIDSRIAVLGGQLKSRISMVPEILQKELKQSWSASDFAIKLNELFSKAAEKNGFPENSFKLSTTNLIAHSRASLKIQDGCNNNCSYCAIHIARGHSVSIPVETAIERVKTLEKAGYDEIVLTTVNIGQYRQSYNGQTINFAKLLKILLENTDRVAYRISSLYPEIVDEEFCSVIAESRVRPHFHLSVQSGSNKILKLMNRQYGAEEVVKACNLLRKAKTNPFIACDIITGFPGETDEDFAQTLDLCNNCNFTWIHAFPFSERPGTVAAAMKNKVPQSISGERAAKLVQLASENKIKYINSYIGKPLTAILETVKRPAVLNNASPVEVFHAVTENFLHCSINTSEDYAASKTITLVIDKPLTENILKGGEIEALAHIKD